METNSDISNGSRILRSSRALSLVEMLISITIIGILGSLALVQYGDTLDRSVRVVSVDFVEQLNTALNEFEQVAWQLDITANNDAITEEQQILAYLQTKDVTVFGSPHFRGDFTAVSSSDNTEYRIRWNGARFELVEPGTDGNGMLFEAEGGQFTAPSP